MSNYEVLASKAVDRGLKQLEKKAKDLSYDGVCGVRISHPSIVEGGVEVIIYGTLYKKKANETET